MGEKTPDRVMLKNVRINFFKAGLWVPAQYEGQGDFKRSALFVIEPGSANDKAIIAGFEYSAEKVWGKKWKDILATVWGRPKECAYTKGDLKDIPDYQGKWILNAKRRQQDGPVKVLDRSKDADGAWLTLGVDDGRPYPGCIVNASVEIWCQKAPHIGARCKLVTVQFVKDADAFGGGPATADGFEEVVDEEGDDLAG